jgi:short-subunit dehydrogenase
MTVKLKPLDRQVIVITGASSGIGLATARRAGAAGARLVLAARSRDALHRLAAELRAGGGSALPVVADVSSEADVRRIADEARRVYGGFDTWINNAAVSAYGPCRQVSIEDMRRILDTNFWGVVYGSRVACEHLAAHGGALINIGSIVSDRAVPLQAAYSASKHAIKAWTDTLRAELEHDAAPMSVTLIKPSAIDTPYAEHAANYLPDQPSHVPPVYAPESVAQAILYAAAHPTREVTVGAAGRMLALGAVLTPRLVDRIMSGVLLPGTHAGRPPHGRANLFQPSEDLRERGEYQGLVRRSVYTALVTHPRATAVAAIAGAIVVAAARQMRRASGSLRPNTRRSAVRAAQ